MAKSIWKYAALCFLASVSNTAAFAQYAKLAVVNEEGEVWSRDVDLSRNTIGAGEKLAGPGLFGGPDHQFVVASGNAIAVVTRSGAFWPRTVDSNNAIGSWLQTSGSLFGGPNAKYLMYQSACQKVFVVNTKGEVWSLPINTQSGVPKAVGSGEKMNGSNIFGGPNDKYVVLDNSSRILVINNNGEVWAHDLIKSSDNSCSFDSVGAGYKLNGPGLFGAPNDKYVVALDGNILVINNAGEVWARKLTRSTIGSAAKLNGPGLFGGRNDKYVVTYNLPQVLR